MRVGDPLRPFHVLILLDRYFAYGGSTVIAIFPKGLIEFDDDLLKNSENTIETLMKVGYSIGKKQTGIMSG